MTDERTANFTTSCEKCVFAQYDYGDGDINFQTGCDFNRLEKYKSKGKAHRTTGEFYLIDGICNMCRGDVWANQHLEENLISVVEKEIELRVDFIIVSIDESLDKITKRLPELIRQCVNQKQIKPQQILVVLRNNSMASQVIYDILKEDCGDIPYKLIKIIDLSANIFECLDMGVKKCTSQYYAVFDLCNNIPINLIQTLNNIVNNELKPLILVEPIHNFSGMIVQTYLHNLLGGNREYIIREKIKEIAQVQGKEEYIYTWEQLWTE